VLIRSWHVLRALSRGALRLWLALVGLLTAMSALGLLLPLGSLSVTAEQAAAYDAVLLYDGNPCDMAHLCEAGQVRPLGGVAVVLTNLRRADAPADGGVAARLDLTAEPQLAEDVLLPGSTEVGAAPVGEGWIDMTSATARAVGVEPGDQVVVGAGGREHLLAVRRELLITIAGEEFYAVADSGSVDYSAEWERPYFHYVATPDVGGLVHTVDALGPESGLAVDTKAARDAAAQSATRTALLVLGVVSVLGVLGAVAVCCVEGARFGRRQKPVVAVLEALGVTRRRSAGHVAVMVAVIAGSASLIAWIANVRWIHHGWLSPAVPQGAALVFAGALAGACLVAVTIAVSMLREKRGRRP
jgi:hypothetical protein